MRSILSSRAYARRPLASDADIAISVTTPKATGEVVAFSRPLTVLVLAPTLHAGAADAGAVDLVRILRGAGHRVLIASNGGRLEDEVFGWVPGDDELGEGDEVDAGVAGAFDVVGDELGVAFEVADDRVALCKRDSHVLIVRCVEPGLPNASGLRGLCPVKPLTFARNVPALQQAQSISLRLSPDDHEQALVEQVLSRGRNAYRSAWASPQV